MRMTGLSCAILTVFICGRALAVTLAPGESIQSADLPEGSAVDDSGPFLLGFFAYDQPPIAGVRQVAYYNMLASQFSHDAAGNAELVYGFGFPAFGERPPLPGDPVVHVFTLPFDAVVSISGFGTHPVDVTLLAGPAVSVDRIFRSADGDVISFTGFSGSDSGLPGDGFALMIPDAGVTQSLATVSLLDVEGNPRTLSGEVLVPSFAGTAVPEPASLVLIPLALGTFALRCSRRIHF